MYLIGHLIPGLHPFHERNNYALQAYIFLTKQVMQLQQIALDRTVFSNKHDATELQRRVK